MKKLVAVVVITVGLLVVLFFGLRDIQRIRSGMEPGQTGNAQTGKSSEAVTTIRFVKNPSPAPEITLRDLDGHTISSADWSGKVVLLNFWATWCPPCRAEIPDLIQLQDKYAGRLLIIGLSDDVGSPEKVKQFAQQMHMNYPIVIASPELEAKFGGVMGLPTSFLLDPKGRVVQKHVGLRNPALYDAEIRYLLGLPVQAKVEAFEDTGQIFLANAKNATEIPGVDLSQLTPEQKKAALRQLNEQGCTCNCGLTLAQCRINDTSCAISSKLAGQVLEKIRRGSG